MKGESGNEELLVRYLLGELSEEEETRLEDRYCADDDLHEHLQAVELELIDRYVNNELSKTEQERFEEYFLSVPERLQEIEFARAFKAYAARATVAGPVKKPEASQRLLRPRFTPLRFALLALIVVGLGLFIWRVILHESLDSKITAALNEAYHEQRPTPTRISELDYAPLIESRGGNQENADNLALNRAEMIALEAVHDHPGADSYHAVGRVYLAKHNLDAAIIQLQKALESDSTNAQIYNDLGVALFEKARVNTDFNQKAIEIAQSRVNFDKAIELDKSFPEPVFNRALWYEYMSLPEDASREWQNYLEKDPRSPWANEARGRLKAIEDKKNRSSQTRDQFFQDFIDAYHVRDDQKAWQAFTRSRARTGNGVTERLLGEYLESSAAGRGDEAHSRIQILSYAGDLEYHRVGDRFTKELALFYGRATPAQQKLIIRARESLKSANESCKQTEYEKALGYFSTARELFERSGDYCETAFSELWIGNCNLRISPDKSIPIFTRLSEEFGRKEFKWLSAQALYGLSDAESSKRNFTKTLEYSTSSSRILNEVEDLGGVFRNMQFPVAMHQQYGEYEKSLCLVMRAFDLAASFSPEPQDLWVFYHQAAVNFHSLDYPTLALGFEQVALNIARELAMPIYISRSYAYLGLIHQKLKEYDQAISNAQLSLTAGERIGGDRSRNNLVANSTLHLAHIYRESGDYKKALECYNRAIELHTTLNLDIYMFQAHRGKLLSLIALNDTLEVSKEIKQAVELIEEYRPKIKEESNRNSFFNLAQSIYDISIDFSFSKLNDDKAAFHYSELSRARSLWDLLTAGSRPIIGANTPDLKLKSVNQPLELSQIVERIHAGAQLLQYAVLDDKLLVWLISKDSLQSRQVDVTADQINSKTERFLSLLSKPPRNNSDEALDCARDLYKILIGPVKDSLDDRKQLYIIPDKALNKLPFGALLSGSNKFLIEDYTLAYSSSSSVFIKCSENSLKKGAIKNEAVLSIGNPRVDRNEFPSLADLRSAAGEAKDIAALYERKTILLAEEATPARIKDEMAKADVIHYAGHFVVSPESPMLSRLALAKSASNASQALLPNGNMTAAEIYNMKFPQTRLVVLAACQTGIERAYKGEGAISMARPFITAGVPVVIASLWPIETESSAELMVDFHRYRKGQYPSTAEALRRAQIEMIGDKTSNYSHPYFWASFAVIGGFADF